MLERLSAGLKDAYNRSKAFTEAAVNEEVIRVAITGLSRAGKTTLLTSLLSNLMALGNGVDALPALYRLLDGAEGSRLLGVRIVPAGATTLPHFDYAAKLAELASTSPSWPLRTDDLAQVSLDLVIERTGPFWRKLGPKRVRLELLDYPGEWLLDLPMLEQTFERWSEETVALLRSGSRAAFFAQFLSFLNGIAPDGPADDSQLRRGYQLYRDALLECRAKLGLRFLQPGRFLCPGPRGDAPFMWFFPLSGAHIFPTVGTASALLRDRFEAYKSYVRSEFFDSHFTAFDRQIVLVDVLGALHAGREAFDDTKRAIAGIARGMSYGSNLLGRPMQKVGAAALRAGAVVLRPDVYLRQSAVDLAARAVMSRRIERVAFVATKADHVPALRRENLRNLLRSLIEQVDAGGTIVKQPTSFHAAAAVHSTRDGITSAGGRSVEVVYGTPLGERCERPFYPGDVPSSVPPDSFWTNPFFELPTFVPPRIDASGRGGIPHLGLDEVIANLLLDAF